MKCKDCAMFYHVGMCECGKEIYVCTEENPSLVQPELDWCDGIEDG